MRERVLVSLAVLVLGSGSAVVAGRLRSEPAARPDGGRSTIAQPPRSKSPWLKESAKQMLSPNARLPLAFVPNVGQFDERVRFHAQGPGYGLYVTPQEIVIALLHDHGGRQLDVIPAASAPYVEGGTALALRFVRGNQNVTVEPQAVLPGTVSYFVSNDPSRWRSGLSRYAELVYRDLWPGIDMRLRSEERLFKYEFIVRPGGRVEDIRLTYDGVSEALLDGNGQLRIETSLGSVVDERPRTYQLEGDRRKAVESEWLLASPGTAPEFGFRVAGFDRSRPLVIDPGLTYSSYLGGSQFDISRDIAVDGLGNTYVTGGSLSPDFPTSVGALVTPVGSVFVSKFDPSGEPVYLALFGGATRQDLGYGIAVDAEGNVFLTGRALSPDFPTTPGAFDRTLDGFDDAFIVKLNPSGSALVYSTFLGGTDEDQGLGIAIDADGSAFVTGVTFSDDFPLTKAAFDTFPRGYPAFVTKLSPDGSALAYSSYLEQGYETVGRAVAVSSNGEATVVGYGTGYAMIARVTADGSGLVYNRALSDRSNSNGIVLDSEDNAVVVGSTTSADFPITSGAYDSTFAGTSEAFVAKLDPLGTALVFSTFLGGSGGDDARDVTIDSQGRILVAGFTGSEDFPTTPDAYDRTIAGSDVFVARLDPSASRLLYSTLMGGADTDLALAVAVDPEDEPHISGQTVSRDFPSTPGAFDRDYNGGFADAFVAALETMGPSCRGLSATIIGTRDADVLVGTGGKDVIVGRGGNDSIEGRLGDDIICGGPGEDTIDAGGGLDEVLGDAGADRILGGAGEDILIGGPGDDLLRGEAGNDHLQGDGGNDLLNGGTGFDTCQTGSGTTNSTAQCERF